MKTLESLVAEKLLKISRKVATGQSVYLGIRLEISDLQ